MALVVADRVKETTTSTGTGAISLAGAEPNFRTFSSVLSDADTTYYAIIDDNNLAFEVGLGTYASSGNTITRTTVLASSNSNNAVNFSAGTKDVFITYPADKSVNRDASGNVSVSGAVTATQLDLTAQGDLRLQDSSGGQYVALQAAATVGSSFTLTLPTADGSADEFLKTDGSGNLSFGAAGGGFTSMQVFTSSGTYTKPSGISKVRVYVTGGGGGGGGSSTANHGGAGGGAGGTSVKVVDVSSISTVAVTIGSGGSAGSGADGSSGGNSSFGSYGTGNGGSGGDGGAESFGYAGGTGGTASAGDYNITGGDGGSTPAANYSGGTGGSSFYGGGGRGGARFASSAEAGKAYGSGGGGNYSSGADGKAGIIVVEEYA